VLNLRKTDWSVDFFCSESRWGLGLPSYLYAGHVSMFFMYFPKPRIRLPRSYGVTGERRWTRIREQILPANNANGREWKIRIVKSIFRANLRD